MNRYNKDLQEEKIYLQKTLSVLSKELNKEIKLLEKNKKELLSSRKEMWDNTVHFPNDFDRLPEVVQYLSEINIKSFNYDKTLNLIQTYRKMIDSPYFGRFDFLEEDCKDEREKIYIGLGTVYDKKSGNILVYDWRAPISSIYYQYELGKAFYKAPSGMISGEVFLKRQYRIQHELKYFFDCSIKINDDVLQQVLSCNASAKMKKIVETIQRDQDKIIRDTENELLIVQGTAGSGKTSIALHRIAYLLYNGLKSNIYSKNMLIISPNDIFSKYISNVLPELGEENVRKLVLEDYVFKLLKEKTNIETRKEQLEYLILLNDKDKFDYKKESIEFKGSKFFIEIIDRLVKYYEKNIEFQDIYYDGKIIETKQQLKNKCLNNKFSMPLVKKLKIIENIIFKKIQLLRKQRLNKIEKVVQEMEGHELEIKSFSRLLCYKQFRIIMKKVKKFTSIDYFELYRLLFNNEEVFYKVASGIKLPKNISTIIKRTKQDIENGCLSYEDSAPLLYLKFKIEGVKLFSDIKYVVIDEAQDYYPIHYEIFKLIFKKDTKYTVLGDIHQTIEKKVDMSFYNNIIAILNGKKAARVLLNKSYRSSYEICSFAQRFLNEEQEIIPFERHERMPEIIFKNTVEELIKLILKDIKEFIKSGYETIAIICKTNSEAEKLYNKVKNSMKIKLINSNNENVEKGVIILPSYIAKGLEFDVVLAFNFKVNYNNDIERRLLYIVCTRALHRLVLYSVN